MRLSPSVFLRLVAVIPVLASLGVIGSTTGLGPSVAGCAHASSVHHAALVVEHGDGAVITACVAFSADSISGDQLLALSHVQYATADYGTIGKAVCQIDGEPAQYPASCWTASSPYWAMDVSRGGGAWGFSSLGVSAQTLRDGDAEGFRYQGQSDSLVPPSPHGVCPPPSTATPVPVRTPTPTTRATTRTIAPARSAHPSPGGTATAAAPLTAGTAPLSPEKPNNSPTSAARVAALNRLPLSPPGSSAGALAASALGALLLVSLGVQVMRVRGRRALTDPTGSRRR